MKKSGNSPFIGIDKPTAPIRKASTTLIKTNIQKYKYNEPNNYTPD